MSYDFNLEKQEYTQAFYELMLSVLTASGGGLDVSAPRLSLIASVKLKIDELQPTQEGLQLVSAPTNMLDMYINGLLDESAKHILQLAPPHVIVPVEGREATVVQEGDVGYIILPEDYIRFVLLKMQGWSGVVTEAHLATEPLYKKQKYPALRGGLVKPKVFVTSRRIVNPQSLPQIDTVDVAGGGKAVMYVAGLTLDMIGLDADEVVVNFTNSHTGTLDAAGVVLSDDGSEKLTFTSKTAGESFASPYISTLEGDLTGARKRVQDAVAVSESKRVLEYYSLPGIATHTIEMFNYIGLAGAEHLQTDLHDALTWLCASKVLQVMGNNTDQNGSSQKATEQVQISLQNLV
jgi:hypothetical protein